MSRYELTRRDLIRLSIVGATALAANLAFPNQLTAEQTQGSLASSHSSGATLYARLLQTWCDGLLAYQETTIQNPALHGALLCPACALIHGRCGDAVYPLLHMAHSTGNEKYLRSARLVCDWSEQQVSRSDGSWINDVTLSSWQGITAFHTFTHAKSLATVLDRASAKSL